MSAPKRKMNKEEFKKLSVQCGYSNKAAVEAYVKENPKEEYTIDDFIALHNKSMHWEGCKADKGLIPVYGINGKTTAKRNGVAEDYGTGQDWR